MNQRAVVLCSILLLLLSSLLTGCGSQSGVRAILEPGQTAALGGVMSFKSTITYSRDAPSDDGESGAEVVIGMSSDLSLLDAGWTLKEQRDGYTVYVKPIIFQAGVPQTFQFQVKLNQPGSQSISAGARIYFSDGGKTGNEATKLLEVTPNGTTVSDLPLAWPTEQPTPQ